MNELRIINEQTVLNKQFKVYGTIQDPLFLARDVAEWIDYDLTSVNKLVESVDDDEKLNGTIFRSGQQRQAWFLTESGLYEVLMQSRKPIARLFKKEVKKILKDLRLYVQYKVPQTYAEALLLAAMQQEEIEKKNQMIGELKPKADYLDRILKSKSLLTITQIAKDYGMSGIAMNQKLHELGIQYKQSDQWLLYERHHDKGYTSSETFVVEDVNGRERVVMNTKWTMKGRVFLYNLLKDQGIIPTIERQ